MIDKLAENWNNRYKEEVYAYGKEPNVYFKQQIDRLKPGKILFAGEGEGRNAVYAAKHGWNVHAFDISTEAKKKAERLAKENNAAIEYQVGNLQDLDYPNEEFDVIVLIFTHFPPAIRKELHKILTSKLKKNGLIIFEGFSKNHFEFRKINPKVGGPPNLQALVDLEDIKKEFYDYKILSLEEIEVHLEEGIYHNGTSAVIRFLGQKIE